MDQSWRGRGRETSAGEKQWEGLNGGEKITWREIEGPGGETVGGRRGLEG